MSGGSSITAAAAQAAAAGRSSSSGSGWGVFGRRKHSGGDAPHGDGGDRDDAVSVSSHGSDSTNASRRSIGKGMLGAMKKLSYSIVYDDSKC
jgi:hypothetical protein